MTQLEYVVGQYIKEHPRCTQADILASFSKPPEKVMLMDVLEALRFQHHIQILPSPSPAAQEPPITYYAPTEDFIKADTWLKA